MKILSLLSGGMDSAALVYLLKDRGHEVEGVSFDYGQRHGFELEAATAVAKTAGIDHVVVDLSSIGSLLSGSALTDDSVEVPHGHYADESMKKTVVPNRNLIMLSIAAGIAISRELDAVAYAAHAGDHPIYPDCRPEFAMAAQKAIQLGNWHQIELVAPFAMKTKTDIAKIGAEVGAPFELTWSCYEGSGLAHCGKCGTCVERREAFEEAGVTDPTVYEDDDGPQFLSPAAG